MRKETQHNSNHLKSCTVCELVGFMTVFSITTKILATNNRIHFRRGKMKWTGQRYKATRSRNNIPWMFRKCKMAHMHAHISLSSTLYTYVKTVDPHHRRLAQRTGDTFSPKGRLDLCIHLEERNSSQCT